MLHLQHAQRDKKDKIILYYTVYIDVFSRGHSHLTSNRLITQQPIRNGKHLSLVVVILTGKKMTRQNSSGATEIIGGCGLSWQHHLFIQAARAFSSREISRNLNALLTYIYIREKI